MSNTPNSPCIKVCKIHPITKICLGCKRTEKEISLWPYYTDEEKRKVLKELTKRSISI